LLCGHARRPGQSHRLFLPDEAGAFTFRHFWHGAVEDLVEQAGLDDTVACLAIHGVVQAAAVGRRILDRFFLGLGDLSVQLAADDLGVERILLLLLLPETLGDGRELVAKALHGGADRRAVGIGNHAAGIEPALGELERDGRHQ
jgi:hypothetical protein